MSQRNRNARLLTGGIVGVPPGYGDQYWDDVTLLLDGSSPTNDISSNDQDASLSFKGTAFSASTRTGPGSQGTRDVIDLNGSNQFIVSSYYTSNLYSQDFTIEGWYDIDVLSGTHTFWAHRNDAASGVIEKEGVQAYCNSSAYGFVVGNTSSWLINAAGGTPSTGWHHIALTRSGNDYTLYVDGVSTVSASSSGTVVASGGLSIGSGADTTAGTQWLEGAVMDFRVTEGVARYTAAFTPPTASFPTNVPIVGRREATTLRTRGYIGAAPAVLVDTFTTWDPNALSPSSTLLNNNTTLDLGSTGTPYSASLGTFSSGKRYAEFRYDSGSYAMLQVLDSTRAMLSGYWSGDGSKHPNGTSYGNSFAVGDIIRVAIDADNGAVWWAKNEFWQNGATASEIASGNTSNAAHTGQTGPFRLGGHDGTGSDVDTEITLNTGQDATFNGAENPTTTYTDANGFGEFYYEPPAGFVGLYTTKANNRGMLTLYDRYIDTLT